MPTPRADATARAIDAVVAEAMQREQLPGVSVAVLRGERLVHAKGYGFADIERKARATATTVYPLGSISKQFTAAGVLFLAERQRLRLSDPVGTYWPALGERHPQVTIEQLLRHTAGLREFLTLPGFGELAVSPQANGEALLGTAAAYPAGFAPGTRWSYSNTNYQVLARLIESINGEPYERFLAEVFFKHLGLTSLRHCSNSQAADEAAGYMQSKGRNVPAPRENMNLARGDGGLCGNAVDLVRWARALLRTDALAPASVRQLAQPTTLADGTVVPYGLGVALAPFEGRRRISHNGAIGGYQGTLTYYPDDDLTIAVLTNRALATSEALEKAIARAVLRLRAPRVALLPTPAPLLQRLPGSWEIGVADLPVTIEQRGAQLWLVMPPPGVTAPLLFQGDDRFIAWYDAVEVRVAKGPDGSDRLLLTLAGLPWIAVRGDAAALSAWTPPPTDAPAPSAPAAVPAAPQVDRTPPPRRSLQRP